MSVNLTQIVDTLEGLFADAIRPLALHTPRFSGHEWQYVKDCIDSTWVSSVGEYVTRFEQALATYTGAPHAVAVVNGTSALHTGMLLMGIGEGDEVLLPALTFVATANAVSYCGAVPHFVDVDTTTLGVDPVRLRAYLASTTEVRTRGCFNKQSGRRIPALIVVHAFGHPAPLDALLAVCQEFKLELIEDAAESLGSQYQQRHTGTVGRFAALSFNGNKIITTGGGGALLCHDEDFACRAHHLTTTAKLAHPWEYEHDQVAYNYRMPNVNAALGLAQMEQLGSLLKRKRSLAERYQSAFSAIDGVTIFCEPEEAHSNYWLNLLVLSEADQAQRDALLTALHEAQFLSRPAWNLLHRSTMYRDCPRMPLEVSENLERRIICLPSGAELAQ